MAFEVKINDINTKCETIEAAQAHIEGAVKSWDLLKDNNQLVVSISRENNTSSVLEISVSDGITAAGGLV